jgi:hypothetical protein
MLTAGSWLMDLWPWPRERGQGKKQTPNKPTQRIPNSKAGCLVGHRADIGNSRTSHISLKEEMTKQLLLKDRKKKSWWVSLTTWWEWQSFCLNTSTGLDAEGVTPELLRLKFHCSWTWNFFMCLFVLFLVCLYTTSTCWDFWFPFFSFFLCFIVFTIVS